MRKVLSMILVICLLISSACFAEETEAASSWTTFLLVCNEGMNNEGGDVGNTMMVVSLEKDTGKIKLMMFTWDTFVNYQGYDMPQLISQPYKNNGPEETMRVFNDNFDTQIDLFMSLNYLNLASLIDSYGGVNVDISRAERNALNGIVSNKKTSLQAAANSGLLSAAAVELLAQEYYLNDFGEGTHLNGLQAVGYGWLQYDSVYNCCKREVRVIANLFNSVGTTIGEKVVFYTNDSDAPDESDVRRKINLDAITDEDIAFLSEEVAPIFDMSYNNLTNDDIVNISVSLMNAAYAASRQGINIFETIDVAIFPLEATEAYEVVAGTEGHVIDAEANAEAIAEFLYSED